MPFKSRSAQLGLAHQSQLARRGVLDVVLVVAAVLGQLAHDGVRAALGRDLARSGKVLDGLTNGKGVTHDLATGEGTARNR